MVKRYITLGKPKMASSFSTVKLTCCCLVYSPRPLCDCVHTAGSLSLCVAGQFVPLSTPAFLCFVPAGCSKALVLASHQGKEAIKTYKSQVTSLVETVLMEGSQSNDNYVKLVEIKIKTLDSQVYTCTVDQNISVPILKERVATLTGVPVENQRLICRGKVLKDGHSLSAYNVEDGHTLHLVTRQVPQPGAASSSAGAGGGEEEQGMDDPSTTASLRPTQISHSVVMGTFNVPDGDGGLPDVNRIISSVLSSLGMANLVPNTGAIGLMANRAPAVSGQDVGAGNGMPQLSVDSGNQIQASVAQATLPITAPGFLSAIEQQFRLLQPAMVIPDALTTISQYLDGLEQALASNGQHASPAQATSSVLPGGPLQAIRGRPTPANLGALIRRTIGLLTGQASLELERLSSQLVSEPNMNDAGARGELQSGALRDGVLLQHLGALLLELGRATLTLRMGTSPMESAVNAGPAVFISPAGPNPMMVQPLPYQPVGGFGVHHNAGVVDFGEVPRNASIQVHANDVNEIPGFPAPGSSNNIPPQVSAAGQVSGSVSNPATATITPAVHAIAVPMQASNRPEQPGIRVLPMRTVVAGVPGRPIVDSHGPHPNILHPLLARFQQMNPQQVGSQQAVTLQGHPPRSSLATAVAPTLQAQVQVQAWVPDGQGGIRLVSNEEALQTLFTPAITSSALQPQLPAQDIGAANASNQTRGASRNPPVGQQVPGDMPVEPVNPTVDNADGAGRDEATKDASSKAELESNHITDCMEQATGSKNEARTPKPSARQQQGAQDAGTVVQNQTDVKSPDEQGSERGQAGPPLVPDSNMNLQSYALPASQFITNVPLQRGDAGNLDIRSLISQLTATNAGGTPPSRARETSQGLGLPAGGLGNLLGQGVQNPFLVEQVEGGALDEDDAMAQGAHSQSTPQGGVDFARLLQDMMPLVDQAMNRVNTAEGTSGPMQSVDMRAGAISTVRANVEGTTDATTNIQNMLSNGLNVSSGANLPALFQEMMPVLAQAFGGSLNNRNGQPLLVPSNAEDGRTADMGAHQLQDTRERVEESEQVERQNGPQSERQDGAPTAKRQKIHVAKALEMLEQGSPPDEIFKVIAETASMLMATKQKQETDSSLRVENLCQDDCLVDDYMTLLLRDLSAQNDRNS